MSCSCHVTLVYTARLQTLQIFLWFFCSHVPYIRLLCSFITLYVRTYMSDRVFRTRSVILLQEWWEMEFLSWDILLTSFIYAFQPSDSCGNSLHLRLLECSPFSCQMDSPKPTQRTQVQSDALDASIDQLTCREWCHKSDVMSLPSETASNTQYSLTWTILQFTLHSLLLLWATSGQWLLHTLNDVGCVAGTAPWQLSNER